MANRAVAVLTHAGNYLYLNNEIAVTASVAIVGDEYGDIGVGRFDLVITGINANWSSTSIKNHIKNEIKSYMVSKNVPFISTDTVRLLSQLV